MNAIAQARLSRLGISIYADGADLASLTALAAKPWIAGLTTNPTLLRRAGVADYETFARELLAAVPVKPISFEVLADDFPGMIRQARRLAAWGANVYVKIPITDTHGAPTSDVIRLLSAEGIKLNVTAILAVSQAAAAIEALHDCTPGIVSLFAGRVADTGVDPHNLVKNCLCLLASRPRLKLLWASTREVFNLIEAARLGCDIVTVPPDLLAKAERLLGYDLLTLSRETVQMFAADAAAAGYTL